VAIAPAVVAQVKSMVVVKSFHLGPPKVMVYSSLTLGSAGMEWTELATVWNTSVGDTMVLEYSGFIAVLYLERERVYDECQKEELDILLNLVQNTYLSLSLDIISEI
jgi:hypothetical protein